MNWVSMTFRRFLYRLHLAAALVAGLWLAAIGASGALLVFGRGIDAALAPDLFEVEPSASRVALDEVVQAVSREYPDEPVFRIRLPQRAGESIEVWLSSTTGRRVFVDPRDGRLLGQRSPQQTWTGFVRRVHVELLLGDFGRVLVGLCGLCLLFLVASGLWMWWPGWRPLRHQLRRELQLRSSMSRHVRLYLRHRIIGAAASLPLALSAVTGLSLVFDHEFQAAVAFVSGLPVPAKPPRTPPVDTAARFSLDASIRAAQLALPEAQITWIWLPSPSNGTVAVRMRDPRESHPNGKSYVYLDGETSRVLGVVDALRSKDVSRITNQLYPLHIGKSGGVPMRAAMLVWGFAPAALCITGAGSWWLRRRRRSRKTNGIAHNAQ